MHHRQHYYIYGLRVASELPLPGLFPEPADGPPELVVSLVGRPLLDDTTGAPLYASAYRTDSGESQLSIYAHPEGDLIRFAGVAEYVVNAERVRCYPQPDADPGSVAAIFLGAALSLYLERRGNLAIHASVVNVDGHAVAFLSHSGAGKSTLAASLTQLGYSLLSDDILALVHRQGGFVALPSYAMMRLHPSEALHFLGHYEDLPRVVAAYEKRRLSLSAEGPIPFCRRPQPLSRLFLPTRLPPEEGDHPTTFTRMTPRDALMEYVRQSFAARTAETLGMQRTRLPLLAALAESVPLDRLTYASGLDRLPEVCRAVLERIGEPQR